ncbi:MAG TPA: 4-hydroxy-3-methylbut-2-enyl diphosphate reductase [bacterium]|nr:4-hydroxy-3-methylbut-2-enyl diphosphate reductase [bacterium]
MKVRVAKSAGFCMGVRKAMDRVIEASRGREVIYTLGPLVHNPQALEMLEARNVHLTKEIDKSYKDKTVVIRAHGVPPEIRKQLKEIGSRVVDGTCPNVLRSQGIIKKYYNLGYSIVIVGDRGHAEIDALLGYTDNTGTVIENIDEAQKLPHMEKVCVVAQTTLNIAGFEEITTEISKHTDECYVSNTICSSTERRQNDIRGLAELTDATVVVGGKNSANTNRLAEISRELGQPTYFIEDSSELDLEELSRYNEIGVTAGASTPQWVIQEVVDALSAYTPDMRRSFTGFIKSVGFLAVEGNFFSCLSAAALTYAMCLLMLILPKIQFLLMSFFYLFPMHTINKYLEINWKFISMKERAPFIRKYWEVFLGCAVVSLLISLIIAWQSGIFIFSLVSISYLLGGFYSVNIIPSGWNIRFKSIRDIPGSKDIMIATAWTFAVVFLPAITHDSFPGLITIAGGTYVFILVFSKATILAIGGVQSDKLVGLETIPVLIGKVYTEKLLYALNIFLAGGLIILAFFNLLNFRVLVLLLPVLYMIVCIRLLSRKGLFFRLYHQIVLDADIFLTGVLAYMFLR